MRTGCPEGSFSWNFSVNLISAQAYTDRIADRGGGIRSVSIHGPPANAEELFSCFISHSSKDKAFVRQLWEDLRANGVKCWYAPEDLRIGERIRSRIDAVIREHDRFIVVISENSASSQWVEKEVETAFEEERLRHVDMFLPIRLDSSASDNRNGWIGDLWRTRNIADFRLWHDTKTYESLVARILRDLRRT